MHFFSNPRTAGVSDRRSGRSPDGLGQLCAPGRSAARPCPQSVIEAGAGQCEDHLEPRGGHKINCFPVHVALLGVIFYLALPPSVSQNQFGSRVAPSARRRTQIPRGKRGSRFNHCSSPLMPKSCHFALNAMCRAWPPARCWRIHSEALSLGFLPHSPGTALLRLHGFWQPLRLFWALEIGAVSYFC